MSSVKGCENIWFLLVPISNRLIIVIDSYFWLLQIKPSQSVTPDFIANLREKFIKIKNLREAALLANVLLLSVSHETSMDLQEKYKVLFKPNSYLKSETKLVHSDSIRKAKSLQRAKRATKWENIYMKKIITIKKINFRRTDKYNTLNISTYFWEKWRLMR